MYQQKIGLSITSGFLLHLPQFYYGVRHVNETKVEKLIEFLKSKPKCLAEYDEIRELLGESSKGLKKLLGIPELRPHFGLEIVRSELRKPLATENITFYSLFIENSIQKSVSKCKT